MHFPNEPAAHVFPHAATLQHSASRPSEAALHKVENVSCELPPLRLEYQAARQVGPALAGRQVNKLIEAGLAELYPSLRKCLVILAHSRVMQQPTAAEQPLSLQPFVGTMPQVLLGHAGGERLPSVQEQAALCSFLQRLDEMHRSALQPGPHDPFMALLHQCDKGDHSLFYLAVSKGLTGLLQWLLDTQPATFSVTNPFTGESDKKIPPLCLAIEKGDARMVTLLIDRGADINGVSHDGETPLNRAINKSDTAMVSLLFGSGC